MKTRSQQKELEELRKLGLQTVDVKCGTFFSVPRVVDFYLKHYLPLVKELREKKGPDKIWPPQL